MTVGEELNFLLTNRIPRQLLTRLMGWYSRIESPLLTRISLWVWQQFADDFRLHEARRTDFRSVHDCFTRQLKADARPIDSRPGLLVSPCDAVVGEFGRVTDMQLYQAKGMPYRLDELFGDDAGADHYRNGRFVTLRLKSSMYHRFHAPCDAVAEHITYISGDTWNVNPVSLRKIERLFCRNERAVVSLYDKQAGERVALVPVAAVLVASMRFHALSHPLNLQYRGANHFDCDTEYERGQEMGYFEHGSTIILFTSDAYDFCDNVTKGQVIRMGSALMTRN